MCSQAQTIASDSGAPDSRLRSGLAIVFGIFLFASAFSIAAAQVSLGLCVVLYGVVLIRQRSWPEKDPLKPLLVAWLVYFVWLVISSLVNDNPWRSLNCIREEWLLVILPIGLFLNRDPRLSRKLLIALASGLALASVYGIVQHFNGVRFFSDQHLHTTGDSFRLSGSFSHPLTYGYYVVTATVFFLTYLIRTFRSQDRIMRLVLLLTATLGVLASVLSNSRGPMAAFVIGLAALGLLLGRLRWVIVGLIAVAVLALVLSPGLWGVFSQRVSNDWQPDNPEGRVFIWARAWDVAIDNPLFGCGPGNFGEAYAAHLPPEFAGTGSKGHAHDDILHQAAVSGFPAAILFLIFITVAVRHLWKFSRLPGGSSAQRALALAGLVATVAFIAGSLTECVFADEELRQILVAVWAFSWQPDSVYR